MVIPQSLWPRHSQITILGFRVSSDSIDAAQSNAEKSGVAERVTFSVATARAILPMDTI
jgi:23S rRNA G2445 N2-methylase RlmL